MLYWNGLSSDKANFYFFFFLLVSYSTKVLTCSQTTPPESKIIEVAPHCANLHNSKDFLPAISNIHSEILQCRIFNSLMVKVRSGYGDEMLLPTSKEQENITAWWSFLTIQNYITETL